MNQESNNFGFDAPRPSAQPPLPPPPPERAPAKGTGTAIVQCDLQREMPQVERQHIGEIKPLEFMGTTKHYCETCFGGMAKAQQEMLDWEADPANSPLSDDQVRAAVQALGEITNATVGQFVRQINTRQGTPAERQVWRKVIADHNTAVRGRGEEMTRDLLVGAKYRIRYFDPERQASCSGGSLNPAANVLGAAAALVSDVTWEVRGDTVTGELIEKSWAALEVRSQHRVITAKVSAIRIPVHSIVSIEQVS